MPRLSSHLPHKSDARPRLTHAVLAQLKCHQRSWRKDDQSSLRGRGAGQLRPRGSPSRPAAPPCRQAQRLPGSALHCRRSESLVRRSGHASPGCRRCRPGCCRAARRGQRPGRSGPAGCREGPRYHLHQTHGAGTRGDRQSVGIVEKRPWRGCSRGRHPGRFCRTAEAGGERTAVAAVRP
jgi:hypothetical protein